MTGRSEQHRFSALFSDGKEADALRTIGEVAAAFELKQHVLRYWEQQFPMLRPLKRSGGRRYYRPEDVALIGTIDRLVNREGYTLKGARQAIETGARGDAGAGAGAAPAGQAAPLAQADAGSGDGVADFLPRLRAIRERLSAALN